MAIQTITELHDRGVNIKSLTEPDIDTTTPMGRALFGIVAVFAQLRVDTIRDNTRRGLEHARAQGRLGGRPTVMTQERVTAAMQLRDLLRIPLTVGVTHELDCQVGSEGRRYSHRVELSSIAVRQAETASCVARSAVAWSPVWVMSWS